MSVWTPILNVVHISDTRAGSRQHSSDAGSHDFTVAIDVTVEIEPGHVDRDGGQREMLRTAQNAVETAALLGFRDRSRRETAAVPGTGTDEPEHDDDPTRRI